MKNYLLVLILCYSLMSSQVQCDIGQKLVEKQIEKQVEQTEEKGEVIEKTDEQTKDKIEEQTEDKTEEKTEEQKEEEKEKKEEEEKTEEEKEKEKEKKEEEEEVEVEIESEPHEEGPEYNYKQKEFYICLGLGVLMCIIGGICSGLTVGYLSIDNLSLEMKLKNGSLNEKRAATKIIPIIQKHHLLLSTLLICNAFALESLPIFAEKALPSYIAIIVSTFCVVFFAEIIPQAYCTGPDQLLIAEKCVPLIKFMIVLFGVIAYPLGKLLDWLLGSGHGNKRFPRRDLKAIIELHGGVPGEDQLSKGFNKQEVQLISTIIDLRENTVMSILKPMEKVFSLSCQDRLTKSLMEKITSKGYSRIVVHREGNRNDLMGTVRMRDLLKGIDGQYQTIEEVMQIQRAVVICRDTNLLKCLMTLQKEKAALCLVADEDGEGGDVIFHQRIGRKMKLLGLVSIKDLYQALLKKELKDDDNHLSMGSQRIMRRILSRDNNYNAQPRSMANIKIQKKHFKNITKIQEEH